MTLDISRLISKSNLQLLKSEDKEKLNALFGTLDRLNVSMREVGDVEFEITTKQNTSDLIKGLLK